MQEGDARGCGLPGAGEARSWTAGVSRRVVKTSLVASCSSPPDPRSGKEVATTQKETRRKLL